jgi:hypothetical protein
MTPKELTQRIVPLRVPVGVTLAAIDPAAPPCGAKMKGFPLLHLLDVLEQGGGAALVEAWRATLPEGLRAKVDRRSVTSVSWLPIELYFHGVGFAGQALHGDALRGASVVGYQTASADIGAFFRFILSMASPATVLGLSSRFWKSYFDVSSLTVTPTGDRSCIAEVRDWPLRDEVSLYEMVGSLVAWMEASRARDVTMTRFELLAPGHFVMECRWS